MTMFNPDFWEVTLSAESWQQFSTEDGLHYIAPDEAKDRHARLEKAEAFWPQVEAVMAEVLTERQREIVRLYYFAKLNQRQIAEKLGIAQQSVNEHLYGKMRNGHAVGGSIRKLRKACLKNSIRFD